MPTILLVRHGQAAAGFGSHRDPGLDDVGRAQAEAVTEELAARFEAPVPIYSSPLKRAQETAAPLARRWGSDVILEPRVAEIPSPTEDLRERARWLRGVMAGKWTELPEQLLRWRQKLIDCVLGFETDAVVFCHFIAINVVVGAATGAEELIVFRPDNASVTDVVTDQSKLRLTEFGQEANTQIN
ncbi:MAG: phosphoglycerate mutase family protein [Gemmatimonadota bacterium]|nr:phosphoglycerate mutase family protein [Gemmatimonadota bacterium]